MNLVIDVLILKKALLHQEQDQGLHCRNIWEYSCQFSWLHICFDDEKEIDKIYEAELSKSVEYRKWYTEQLPRKYADGQPQRFSGRNLENCSMLNSFYRVLLSVTSNAENSKALVDSTNEIVFDEARRLSIACSKPYKANEDLGTDARRWLREQIVRCFNMQELELLCADLGIVYDDISGDGLSTKVLNLVNHFDRIGKLDKLIDYCRQKRPEKFTEP